MSNRILKESICASDEINSLSWFEECFFYRLIVNCDDYGRLDARPSILKAKLFPLKKDIRENQIEDALKKLSLVGIVQVYECDQKPYLQLKTWGKHQTIRNKRSKYPSIDEADKNFNQMQANENKCTQEKTVENNCMQLQANENNCVYNPIQSESNSNIYVHSDEMHKCDSSETQESSLDTFFESVWELYPIKRGKGGVSKTQKKKLQKIGYEQIKHCVERYVSEQKSKNTSLQYWKIGSTFFNSGYEDYLDSNFKDIVINQKDNSEQIEDRFCSLPLEIRNKLESLGVIEGQSLNLLNATEEMITLLQKEGIL